MGKTIISTALVLSMIGTGIAVVYGLEYAAGQGSVLALAAQIALYGAIAVWGLVSAIKALRELLP